MDFVFILLLAVAAFGVLVYAAVGRRAVLAAVAGVAFLPFAVVRAGEIFGPPERVSRAALVVVAVTGKDFLWATTAVRKREGHAASRGPAPAPAAGT